MGLGQGCNCPCFVDPDDPNHVAIDWDRFLAEGGADAFMDAHQRKREAQVREITGLPEPEPDDEPPINASPRETLDWQLSKGFLDQATYDAIIANNPDLK